MYIGNIKITFREVLVSVIIAFFMGAIGIAIDSKITDSFIENNNVYHKSVKIRNKRSLDYLSSTKVGNSLVEGEFNAVEPCTFNELDSNYSYVIKIKERYTMHTRQVCKKVGKSTQCHTETYWTWDRVNSDEKYAKNIDFYGNKLDTKYVTNRIPSYRLNLNKNINDSYKDKVRGNYLYESSNVRYYYEYVPKSFKGTIFTAFNDMGKGFKNFNLNYDQTIDELIEAEENATNIAGVIFRIIWIVLICVCVYLYVSFENDYLE